MMPKLPLWLILLIAPLAWWSRLRNNPFFMQVAVSYFAAAARVASWLIVSALVFRWGGADQLAVLMLVRGTLGLLTYTSLGLTPSLVQLLSRPHTVSPQVPPESGTPANLEYERVPPEPDPRTIFNTALVLTFVACGIGLGLVLLYGLNFTKLHGVGSALAAGVFPVVLLMGVGMLLRIASDTFAAKLQAARKIGRDSLAQVMGEIVFVGGTVVIHDSPIHAAAMGFLLGSITTFVVRGFLTMEWPEVRLDSFDTGVARTLLVGGSFVMLAQAADWLYAPVNQILIGRFLSMQAIADYVPALQVDAAMLLLVSGLATVLLPYSARAMHVGNYTDLRLIYVGGTIVSLMVLTMGAVFVCLVDGWLFKIWFGDPLPATQAILPLVMIHTVAGGSASIGRSVLFGMGRFKVYAISAIVGGVANVGLAVLFLTTTSLGLRGIIYATVLTVVVRCLIWMPAYTLWSIYKVGGPMRIRWH